MTGALDRQCCPSKFLGPSRQPPLRGIQIFREEPWCASPKALNFRNARRGKQKQPCCQARRGGSGYHGRGHRLAHSLGRLRDRVGPQVHARGGVVAHFSRWPLALYFHLQSLGLFKYFCIPRFTKSSVEFKISFEKFQRKRRWQAASGRSRAASSSGEPRSRPGRRSLHSPGVSRGMIWWNEPWVVLV